jgi:hypothetical protein
VLSETPIELVEARGYLAVVDKTLQREKSGVIMIGRPFLFGRSCPYWADVRVFPPMSLRAGSPGGKRQAGSRSRSTSRTHSGSNSGTLV